DVDTRCGNFHIFVVGGEVRLLVVVVGRRHRDDLFVRRRVVRGRLPAVTGRGDDQRSVVGGVAHRGLQRLRTTRATQRHRDDLRALLVQPRDAVGDHVQRAGAAAVERLADGQLRVERHARDALAVVGVGRGAARDGRAMPVVVLALGRVVGDRRVGADHDDDQADAEVRHTTAVDDLAALKLLVRGLDAGVDDADLDPATVREAAEPGVVPALRRVDVGVRRTARLAG